MNNPPDDTPPPSPFDFPTAIDPNPGGPSFDAPTALDPNPGAPADPPPPSFDASTVADSGLDAFPDLSADTTPSILRDLAPRPSAPFPSDATGRTLARRYHDILAARAIRRPVPYCFPRELGRGRQGVVFLALRQGARGCVTHHAIKLFDPAIYSSAKRYWTDMARIAAQTSKLQLLNSPILVAPDIYEETNGIGYVQMDVVNGVSLRELLDGSLLPRLQSRASPDEWARLNDAVFRPGPGPRPRIQPGIVLYVMRFVLRGLESLHAMGYVHSDVKPANLMVDRLGIVKIIDYGRAMLADEKMTLLLGTPAYMAPEIHREHVARVRSDLYSLGLVGLEMLRGEPLFPPLEIPDTEEGLLAAKLELPSRLHDLLPDYVLRNEDFTRVLFRLLDPDPANRYPSAAEAEADLGHIHKQLTLVGKDSDYTRDLESVISCAVNPLGPS